MTGKEEKCPNQKRYLVGDEIVAQCLLVDKWCLREYGHQCNEYDEIIKEWNEEESNNIGR